MGRVTVLGGAGAVGSVAVRTLAADGTFEEIVIADADSSRAEALADSVGSRARAVKVDAGDPEAVRRVVEGSDVVLNTVGPFFRFGPPVLEGAIRAGVNYVDVCDDFDATERLLAMDERARQAGVTALIGMGSSPGAANVIARFAADHLLDEVEAIDIYHAHGGEPEEGRAVLAHRLHSMTVDIPVFLDGEFRTVRLFEESGRALEEEAEFPEIGTFRVYAYPHPETITFPRHIKGLKRCTNLGLVLPPAYAELIKDVVRLGLATSEPLDVLGQKVIPFEFAISFILSQRPRLLQAAGMKEPVGCLKIVIRGTKDGKEESWAVSLASRGRGMGEGTGIPAAVGAILMAQGKVKGPGVLPPEACVDPADFFSAVQRSLQATGAGGLPIIVERRREGKTERLDVSSLLSA